MQFLQTFSPDVTVLDGTLPEALETALIEAVTWMPLYFLNRHEQFRGHELDMHWYYPLATADDIVHEDVAPKLHDLDTPCCRSHSAGKLSPQLTTIRCDCTNVC